MVGNCFLGVTKLDNWVLEFLSYCRVYPRVMFGGHQSVIDLDLFLFAYKSARIASGQYDRGEDEILRSFSVWLCDVHFRCRRAPWRSVIEQYHPGPTNVEWFFTLFDSFRETINIEWIPRDDIPDRWHWGIANGTHPDWIEFDSQ